MQNSRSLVIRKQQKSIKYILFIVLLLIFISLFTSCLTRQRKTDFSLNDMFTLKIGQSATISEENIEIELIEIIGDSRCPKDVTCIWAGVASCHISLTHDGKSYSLVLNQPGLSEQTSEPFIDYILVYDILPYPSEKEKVDFKDYKLNIEIRK